MQVSALILARVWVLAGPCLDLAVELQDLGLKALGDGSQSHTAGLRGRELSAVERRYSIRTWYTTVKQILS